MAEKKITSRELLTDESWEMAGVEINEEKQTYEFNATKEDGTKFKGSFPIEEIDELMAELEEVQ